MAEVRVGHCIHGLGLGGAQKVIECIARGRSDGFTHLVYSSEDGVLSSGVAEAGAQVRIVQRWIPKLDPLWAVRLGRWMRRDQIDVVHTHLFGDSLHGYLASRVARRLPVIMTLHNVTESRSSIQLRGYRWLIPRACRVVACSKSVRASFGTLLGGAKGAGVLMIPNGIEVPDQPAVRPAELAQMREELGVDRGDVLVAAIGRLSEQKGYRYLIEALSLLPGQVQAGIKLVLFGDGPEKGFLEAEAERLSVRERVVFAGFRSRILRWLNTVDVVVFSSLWEGLPIALLEAMACGRCIVTTDVPGIVEVVGEAPEALIVPRKNASKLSEALSRVASDPVLRRRLGEDAKKRFMADFTATAMVQRYEDLYYQVAVEATSGARVS